ncbi:unnamed protein product [Paramecium sonneborni]|uniref:DH domain-containing protein n=1 Tax=Paramecium sonneborni TaxID=65129 RepID=A0A8S1MJ91_9CILI|nr:unnamed protein product [Paramecium sonneborni]
MIEKLNEVMKQSQDNYGKEEEYRNTRQTGCTEYSQTQSIFFDQQFLGQSQILVTQDEILDEQQSMTMKKLNLIYFRMKGLVERKKYIYMKKWAKYRKHVYQELMMTEQDYLNDLKLVIYNVVRASEQFKLLPENEIQITFSNICHIYEFNQKFYEELKQVFDNYHPNSCFGNIFQKFIPFFKIYFQYYTDYKDYQINYLRQTYPAFNEHLLILEQTNIFRGIDLNSFLVKPIQRLPKYALLVKDLVKHTWKSHPDYQNLEQTLIAFLQVTKKIDHQMGNILKNQALFDLQKKFFDVLNINIVESTRNFILSETVYLKQLQEEPVNLYLCSDMIILSKKIDFHEKNINERLITYGYIDENSNLQNASSNHLQLILKTQDQQIIFICQDLEQQQKLSSYLNNIIKAKHQTIYPKTNSIKNIQVEPIRVFVTEISRGQSRIPFKKFAKYDIKVVYDKKEYQIWTRHKILLKIQKNLKKQYKKLYESLREKCILFQDWIDNKLNKQKNDGRKIIVETFLETLLNSEFVKLTPEYYLQLLGLPQNFYDHTIVKSFSILDSSDESKSSQDS